MNTETLQVKNIVEAALMAASNPLTVNQMVALFEEDNRPEGKLVRDVLKELQTECEGRGIELKEVASGFRYQVKQDYAPWLKKMWEERPPRYSRAFLETLVLIAYRQPVTRAEIEEIRGVVVNSHIIKVLAEREWIKVVGHRDVPGKPALLGTTKEFLDYFNLKNLSDLPTLAEIKDLDSKGSELERQLQLTDDQDSDQTLEIGTQESAEETEEIAAEVTEADTNAYEIEHISEAVLAEAETIVEEVEHDADVGAQGCATSPR